MSVAYLDSYRPRTRVTTGDAPPDYCSGKGAARLSAALKSYWFLRGHDVTTTTFVGETHHLRDHHARTDVRSDMVNGLPRGCVWRKGKVVKK